MTTCLRCGSINLARRRRTLLDRFVALFSRRQRIICRRCGWTGRLRWAEQPAAAVASEVGAPATDLPEPLAAALDRAAPPRPAIPVVEPFAAPSGAPESPAVRPRQPEWPDQKQSVRAHPFRIGIDVDGTIADITESLRHEAEQTFGPLALSRPRQDSVPNTGDDEPESTALAPLRLSPRQQRVLWDHVSNLPNFWTGAAETEAGAVARLAVTAEKRHWEVVFLTSRPTIAGETTQLQTQRWLESHGYPLPTVVVTQQSVAAMATALDLDAVIDDGFENCLEVGAQSKAVPILVSPGYATRLPFGAKHLGVRAVSSIAAALSLLEQLQDKKSGKNSVRPVKQVRSEAAG